MILSVPIACAFLAFYTKKKEKKLHFKTQRSPKRKLLVKQGFGMGVSESKKEVGYGWPSFQEREDAMIPDLPGGPRPPLSPGADPRKPAVEPLHIMQVIFGIGGFC